MLNLWDTEVRKKFTTEKYVNMSENFPQKDVMSSLNITTVVSESYFSDTVILKNVEWRRSRERSQWNQSVERHK